MTYDLSLLHIIAEDVDFKFLRTPVRSQCTLVDKTRLVSTQRCTWSTDSIVNLPVLRYFIVLEWNLQCHGWLIRRILSPVALALDVCSNDKSVDALHDPEIIISFLQSHMSQAR